MPYLCYLNNYNIFFKRKFMETQTVLQNTPNRTSDKKSGEYMLQYPKDSAQ